MKRWWLAAFALAVIGCLVVQGCGGGSSGSLTTSSDTGSTDPLIGNTALTAANSTPTRVVVSGSETAFVTDGLVGATFIYDLQSGVPTPIGQIGGLGTPIGIALDGAGNVYIGCQATKSVEVFNANGYKLKSIGTGQIKLPNALAFDTAGNLYVADSLDNVVKKFGPDGTFLAEIGHMGDDEGGLKFPSALAVATGASGNTEIFVASAVHRKIVVFSADGNFLREFGSGASAFGTVGASQFVMIVAMAINPATGNLHVIDSANALAQYFEPNTGDYLGRYGQYGFDATDMTLPQGIAFTNDGRAIVTDNMQKSVEFLAHTDGPLN